MKFSSNNKKQIIFALFLILISISKINSNLSQFETETSTIPPVPNLSSNTGTTYNGIYNSDAASGAAVNGGTTSTGQSSGTQPNSSSGFSSYNFLTGSTSYSSTETIKTGDKGFKITVSNLSTDSGFKKIYDVYNQEGVHVTSEVIGFNDKFAKASFAMGFSVGVHNFVKFNGRLFNACDKHCKIDGFTAPIISFRIAKGYKITILREIIKADFLGLASSAEIAAFGFSSKQGIEYFSDVEDISHFYNEYKNLSITLIVSRIYKYSYLRIIQDFMIFLQRAHTAFTENYTAKHELKECQTKLDNSNSLLKTEQETKINLDTQCSNYKLEIGKIEDEIKDLEHKKVTEKSTVTTKTEEVTVKVTEHTDIKKFDQDISGLEAKIADITAKINEIDTNDNKFKENIASSETIIKESTTKITTITTKKRREEKKVEIDETDITNLQAQIQIYEVEASTFDAQIQAIKDKQKEYKDKIDKLKNEMNDKKQKKDSSTSVVESDDTETKTEENKIKEENVKIGDNNVKITDNHDKKQKLKEERLKLIEELGKLKISREERKTVIEKEETKKIIEKTEMTTKDIDNKIGGANGRLRIIKEQHETCVRTQSNTIRLISQYQSDVTKYSTCVNNYLTMIESKKMEFNASETDITNYISKHSQGKFSHLRKVLEAAYEIVKKYLTSPRIEWEQVVNLIVTEVDSQFIKLESHQESRDSIYEEMEGFDYYNRKDYTFFNLEDHKKINQSKIPAPPATIGSAIGATANPNTTPEVNKLMEKLHNNNHLTKRKRRKFKR